MRSKRAEEAPRSDSGWSAGSSTVRSPAELENKKGLLQKAGNMGYAFTYGRYGQGGAV